MSEHKTRRSRLPEAPSAPSGYRQTRRGSTASRIAKKAEKRHKVATSATRVWRGLRNLLVVIVQGIAIAGVSLLVLLLIANGVNTFARWNARRNVSQDASSEEAARRAKENLLVIGVEDGRATGFLALRLDRKQKQVFGVAIPEGAFVDIPGRGFERIGEAYSGGPDIALSTVSNFFSVQFTSYLVVPGEAYRAAVTSQTVAGLPDIATESNLAAAELKALSAEMNGVAAKDVALVPMPVKPIKLGEQTYFEPQRDEIADLLKSWWGVDPEKGEQITRVIVYNGAGKPGIAGQAAQELIRAGFRVIDTKNADDFGYDKTEITVKHGDPAQGDAVRQALGVGTVTVDVSTADVTDVIVVIGKDYQPAAEKGEQ